MVARFSEFEILAEAVAGQKVHCNRRSIAPPAFRSFKPQRRWCMVLAW